MLKKIFRFLSLDLNIDVQNGKMLEGDLPSKALSMIEEWTLLHQQALLEMWETQKFSQLPPLE